MRGGKLRSMHVCSGDTPHGEVSRSMHSGVFNGVGSLDTESGSNSDAWADTDAAYLPHGMSNVSSPHVVPNIGPTAVSFPFGALPAFLHALTLALPTFSNAGIGAGSEGESNETTEAKAAATGSLPSRRSRFPCLQQRTLTSGRAPCILFSSAPLAVRSPRGPGAPAMTFLVLSPLRDGALEGAGTGCTIHWDLIGRVCALSVTDMGTLLFYSSCFSSARRTVSPTRRVFWFALPVVQFVLAECLIVKNLDGVSKLQNDKGQVQSSSNTASKSNQVIILQLQSRSSKKWLHNTQCTYKYKASVMFEDTN